MASLKTMLARLGLSTAAILWTASAAAAQPSWYQVELYVFSQNQDNLIAEFWDAATRPQHSGRAASLNQPHADLIALPSSARQLKISKGGMKKQGYRPLFHRVWKQAVYDKNKARPLRIVGGQQLTDGSYELDGEITIDIARYLHLRTNLFYTLNVPSGWKSPYTLSSENLPAEDNHTATDNGQLPAAPGTEAPITAVSDFRDPRLLSVQMQQGRRMRRDELHYLDHPMFGLLIKLTRTSAPDQTGQHPAPAAATEAEASAAISLPEVRTPSATAAMPVPVTQISATRVSATSPAESVPANGPEATAAE